MRSRAGQRTRTAASRRGRKTSKCPPQKTPATRIPKRDWAFWQAAGGTDVRFSVELQRDREGRSGRARREPEAEMFWNTAKTNSGESKSGKRGDILAEWS